MPFFPSSPFYADDDRVGWRPRRAFKESEFRLGPGQKERERRDRWRKLEMPRHVPRMEAILSLNPACTYGRIRSKLRRKESGAPSPREGGLIKMSRSIPNQPNPTLIPSDQIIMEASRTQNQKHMDMSGCMPPLHAIASARTNESTSALLLQHLRNRRVSVVCYRGFVLPMHTKCRAPPPAERY